MSNPKWEEQIIVAPTENIFGHFNELIFQGAETNPAIVGVLLNHIEKTFTTMRRGGGHKDSEHPDNNAEINYDYKQPIPYGVVISDDNDIDGIRVFVYRRLAGGTESRLHDKLSIGVGGHMNVAIEEGKTFMQVVKEEAIRELDEELIFESAAGEETAAKYEFSVVGLINDERDDVGKVHLGILYTLLTPPAHSAEVRETDMLQGEWMTLEELDAVRPQLEGWSEIALDALKEIYA